jgi:hypothetical protein
MRRRWVLTLAVAALLALPTSADAQIDRHCKSVTAGQWKATNIGAFQMGCKSVRDKLKRWLPRRHLPRKRDGWLCTPIAGGRVNRQCTHFNRQSRITVGFVFLRQRR